MEKKIVLTDEGFKKLDHELKNLKTFKRKEIAEKIKVALSFGDLSENSEYDEAKNEQAIIEARILQLESMLKNVEILNDTEISTDVVSIGSKVNLLDIELDEEVIYHIVGSTEADPFNGYISDESPVGKALLSHKIDDIVSAEAPSGVLSFKILDIFK